MKLFRCLHVAFTISLLTELATTSLLTHAHGDHTRGVPAWKQAGTQIIAQIGEKK